MKILMFMIVVAVGAVAIWGIAGTDQPDPFGALWWRSRLLL